MNPEYLKAERIAKEKGINIMKFVMLVNALVPEPPSKLQVELDYLTYFMSLPRKPDRTMQQFIKEYYK
jgi:hypothetical protein